MSQILLITALILGLDGGVGRLDKGWIDGLREGDRGEAFYVLLVNSREVRIAAGAVRVSRIDDFSASIEPLEPEGLRPGYSVSFDVPRERLSAAELLKMAEKRLAEDAPSAALGYFQKLGTLMPGDPLVSQRIQEIEKRLGTTAWIEKEQENLEYYRAAARNSLESGDVRSAESYVERVLKVEPEDVEALKLETQIRDVRLKSTMVQVPAGEYEIGRLAAEARFYNEQPRHVRKLESFWLDRTPVKAADFPGTPEAAGDYVVAVTYAQARDYCSRQGKRLPTEFEWEAAAVSVGLVFAPGISEWTSSWYQPYPGNTRPEKDYGETFKVIRGVDSKGKFDPIIRFYIAPEDRARDVGFRCGY